jgi:hypothetical protein
MSISFACPECKAKIEVGEEHVGHAGQCPRCQKLIVIPSPNQPMPIFVGADAVPREDPKPRRRAEAKEPPARPRRTPATPKQPAGPIWPWVVGVFGALVMAALLFSSFAVLVFWRRPEPTRPVALVDHKHGAINQAKGVTVGRLEEQRAVLQDGVFQIRSELTVNDPIDPKPGPAHVLRCKRFEIELRGDRSYVLELDSNHFDSYIRVENLERNEWDVGQKGVGNARLEFSPPRTSVFTVYASCMDPALGRFTLTIREKNVPKPFVQ